MEKFCLLGWNRVNCMICQQSRVLGASPFTPHFWHLLYHSDRICTEIATKNTPKFRYVWLLISDFCGVPLLVVHCPWFVLFSRLRQYICDFISSLAPLCPTIRFSNARYSQRINQGNFGQNRIGDAT